MTDRILHGRRILVVEDEYMLAADLEMELLDAGAIVLGPFGTLETAIEFIRTEQEIDGGYCQSNRNSSPIGARGPKVDNLRRQAIATRSVRPSVGSCKFHDRRGGAPSLNGCETRRGPKRIFVTSMYHEIAASSALVVEMAGGNFRPGCSSIGPFRGGANYRGSASPPIYLAFW